MDNYENKDTKTLRYIVSIEEHVRNLKLVLSNQGQPVTSDNAEALVCRIKKAVSDLLKTTTGAKRELELLGYPFLMDSTGRIFDGTDAIHKCMQRGSRYGSSYAASRAMMGKEERKWLDAEQGNADPGVSYVVVHPDDVAKTIVREQPKTLRKTTLLSFAADKGLDRVETAFVAEEFCYISSVDLKDLHDSTLDQYETELLALAYLHVKAHVLSCEGFIDKWREYIELLDAELDEPLHFGGISLLITKHRRAYSIIHPNGDYTHAGCYPVSENSEGEEQ